MAMRQRIRTLVTEAWHLVLLVAAGGLCVSGVAALVGFLVGKRGGHEVLTVVIAVGAVGLVVLFTGVFSDPMSPSLRGIVAGRGMGAVGIGPSARSSMLLHDEEDGLTSAEQARFRQDDMLYAGGVLLIGLGVLIGYACSWAGVPPASPFH
jgi:hypothetical protein